MEATLIKKGFDKEARGPPASTDNVLVLQVRAFLEASEDVDIDVETVEDLMQTIPADYEQTSGHDFFTTANSLEDPNNSDEDVDFTEEELNISALYSIADEGNRMEHLYILWANIKPCVQSSANLD